MPASQLMAIESPMTTATRACGSVLPNAQLAGSFSAGWSQACQYLLAREVPSWLSGGSRSGKWVARNAWSIAVDRAAGAPATDGPVSGSPGGAAAAAVANAGARGP